MNWACIIFDAMSIFLNIKQLISKAVHKEILSQILSFTHEANSFCTILLRIAFHMLVLSIQFPMPLLVPSDGLGVAWGWSGAALGWPGGGLGLPWGGLAGGGGLVRGCPGMAWGWPGTILLSGNYPGTIRELSGIWLAGLGWPGWLGQMGENSGINIQ